MSTWKYMQNGQPSGPVETSELQALLGKGTITSQTQVCKEGTTEWVPLGIVPEISGAPALGASAPPSTGISTPASAEVIDPADIEKNKIFAVLAYIGLLFLVPLLAAPQSKFARYHTNQGVLLFIAAIILCVAGVILSMVPFLGCLVMPGVSVAILVLMVMGIINAAGGQCKPLPVIGKFQLLK